MATKPLKEAEKLLKKAEKAKEGEARARLFQEALRVFDATLQMTRNEEVLVGKARCLIELGRSAEAGDTLDEALQLLPGYAPALALKKRLDA